MKCSIRPEAEIASSEVLKLVLAFLEKQHPERFQQIQEDKSLAPVQTTLKWLLERCIR